MTSHSAHILITRPVAQQLQLARQCEQLGLKVSHIPCLAIEGVANGELTKSSFSTTDIVLFTSQNAVRYAHQQRPLPWSGINVHAIGSATATLLATLGQVVDLAPTSPYDSESYVQQVQTLPAQRLMIIKGVAGRSLIAEQLQTSGWVINTVDVYRRSLPTVSSNLLDDTFKHQPPDIISVGSNETLLNLITLTDLYKQSVLEANLLVNSQRCSELACSLGFTQAPLIAVPAGDQGQLRQLQLWLSAR